MVAGMVALGACSSSGGSTSCFPGQTQACLGPAACKGAQACAKDGKSFGPCDCGAGGASGGIGGAGGGTGGAKYQLLLEAPMPVLHLPPPDEPNAGTCAGSDGYCPRGDDCDATIEPPDPVELYLCCPAGECVSPADAAVGTFTSLAVGPCPSAEPVDCGGPSAPPNDPASLYLAPGLGCCVAGSQCCVSGQCCPSSSACCGGTCCPPGTTCLGAACIGPDGTVAVISSCPAAFPIDCGSYCCSVGRCCDAGCCP
jgi:hypothetical protein